MSVRDVARPADFSYPDPRIQRMDWKKPFREHELNREECIVWFVWLWCNRDDYDFSASQAFYRRFH